MLLIVELAMFAGGIYAIFAANGPAFVLVGGKY